MTVLFVCTGNTCRSPMAAAMLRVLLDRRGRPDIAVQSAGLAAFGQPAAYHTLLALEAWDPAAAVFLAGHKSRQATPELLEAADRIVALSPSHLIGLYGMGAGEDKVRVLGDGIDDPYGGSLSVYRETLAQMEPALERLADELTETQ